MLIINLTLKLMMIDQVIARDKNTHIHTHTYVQESQPLYVVGAKALGGA